MLLHLPNKNEETIKSFFAEVHELYIKVRSIPPFESPNVIPYSTFVAFLGLLRSRRFDFRLP